MTAFDEAEVISGGKGEIRLTMKRPGGETSSVHVSKVFYIRGAFNLLSQGQLLTKGIRFEPVASFGFNFYDADGEIAAVARCIDMLFPLETEHVD
jgi:hypothetical protein